jgi:GH18 family chitinase
MATLDDVIAKVTNIGTVEDSVIALLQDLKDKLDAAGTDPAKLQALSDAIDAQTQKLSDAVTANTPSTP